MYSYEGHKHLVTNANMRTEKKHTHPHPQTDTVNIIHYVLLDVLYLFIDCASFKGWSVYLIPLQYKRLLPISTSDTDDTSL